MPPSVSSLGNKYRIRTSVTRKLDLTDALRSSARLDAIGTTGTTPTRRGGLRQVYRSGKTAASCRLVRRTREESSRSVEVAERRKGGMPSRIGPRWIAPTRLCESF